MGAKRQHRKPVPPIVAGLCRSAVGEESRQRARQPDVATEGGARLIVMNMLYALGW